MFKDFNINIVISEISHIGFNDLIETEHLLNPEIFYLTHISEEDEEKTLEPLKALDENRRDKFVFAYDGLEKNLNGD